MIANILIGTLIPLWVVFVIFLITWLCLKYQLAEKNAINETYVTCIGNRTSFFGMCVLILTIALSFTQVQM